MKPFTYLRHDGAPPIASGTRFLAGGTTLIDLMKLNVETPGTVVDLGTLDATPCYDPISHLVHAVGRDAVTDVWVAGRRVVQDRVLMSCDEASIVARAIAWQERLQ